MYQGKYMKKNAHADCQSRTQNPLSFRPNLGVCNSHHSPHPPLPPNKIGKIAVCFIKKVREISAKPIAF